VSLDDRQQHERKEWKQKSFPSAGMT